MEHSDPHSVLGAHPARIDKNDGVVIRAFHPDAVRADVMIDGEKVPMQKAGTDEGLFWIFLPGRSLPFSYSFSFKFADGSEWKSDTPYRFLPTLGELDLHFMGEGKHYNLYEKMGAHPREMDGVQGASFAVWAPNAKRVSVIGDFNQWDGRLYPMRSLGGSGVWELFIPGITVGEVYKYEIKTPSGELRIKTDPYAFSMELRPGTASSSMECGRA